MRAVVAMALVAMALFSGTAAQAQGGDARATVELKNPSGAVLGSMTLAQEGDVVHVLGQFNNLPAGPHGIHIHAVGSCTPDFAAAGGHFNAGGKQHGLENPAGAHAGDMPNLLIGADGMGSYDHKNPMVSLGSGPGASLFDADGSAIVIHAGPDDYRSDPAGNSGARIACGVITLQAAAPEIPAQLPNTGGSTPIAALLALTAAALIGGWALRRQIGAATSR